MVLCILPAPLSLWLLECIRNGNQASLCCAKKWQFCWNMGNMYDNVNTNRRRPLQQPLNITGKMQLCTSGCCQTLQKYSGNASGRETAYLSVKPIQNCKSFVPARALEQGMWLCFSYDQSHVAYTEIKLMWVWSLANTIHHFMKQQELNRRPINK